MSLHPAVLRSKAWAWPEPLQLKREVKNCRIIFWFLRKVSNVLQIKRFVATCLLWCYDLRSGILFKILKYSSQNRVQERAVLYCPPVAAKTTCESVATTTCRLYQLGREHVKSLDTDSLNKWKQTCWSDDFLFVRFLWWLDKKCWSS